MSGEAVGQETLHSPAIVRGGAAASFYTRRLCGPEVVGAIAHARELTHRSDTRMRELHELRTERLCLARPTLAELERLPWRRDVPSHRAPCVEVPCPRKDQHVGVTVCIREQAARIVATRQCALLQVRAELQLKEPARRSIGEHLLRAPEACTHRVGITAFLDDPPPSARPDAHHDPVGPEPAELRRVVLCRPQLELSEHR